MISAAVVAAEFWKRATVDLTLSAETAVLLGKQTTKPLKV